jgi:hypothetical protein
VSNGVLKSCFFRPFLKLIESIQVVWEVDGETKQGLQKVQWAVRPVKDREKQEWAVIKDSLIL